MAKRSEATRDFTDTNWDGALGERERLAIVVCDTGTGFLKAYNVGDSAADEEAMFLVSLPGKFHKLIWFLRGDIIVHDTEVVVRKVSEEQLRRLAKEEGQGAGSPTGFAAAFASFSARKQDTLRSDEEHREQAARRALAAKDDTAQLAQEALRGNPNRASYRVKTGFTSSDDDDDDDEAGEEAAEEEEEDDREAD